MIIWMTGLSGAGKSTYSKYLKEKYDFLEIDGDDMRATLSADLGYSWNDKVEHGRRMINLCKMFHRENNVVVSTITATNGDNKSGRRWVFNELEDLGLRMVWVKASVDTCRARDPKGIYKENPPYLSGVNSPWEDPYRYDLCLDTELRSIEENCEILDIWLESHAIHV
jgi:adenylylsulfate kinase-like enzyme